MNKIRPAIFIIALTLGVFALTKNPYTGPFKLQMLLFVLLAFAFYRFSLSRKKIPVFGSSGFVYLFITLILFLVGATGWFFSPFFFTLYLLGITLALMYSPAVSISFIVTLVVLFSFNVGEVDLAYEFLIILSLLFTIPVGLLLRKEYLKLKESSKEILVLQHEQQKYKNVVDEVLTNTMNNFAVNLRQPLNDIKQLAYLMGTAKGKGEEKDRERIIASSEEALRILKDFEEETTGKKLLSTPSVSPSPLRKLNL